MDAVVVTEHLVNTLIVCDALCEDEDLATSLKFGLRGVGDKSIALLILCLVLDDLVVFQSCQASFVGDLRDLRRLTGELSVDPDRSEDEVDSLPLPVCAPCGGGESVEVAWPKVLNDSTSFFRHEEVRFIDNDASELTPGKPTSTDRFAKTLNSSNSKVLDVHVLALNTASTLSVESLIVVYKCFVEVELGDDDEGSLSELLCELEGDNGFSETCIAAHDAIIELSNFSRYTSLVVPKFKISWSLEADRAYSSSINDFAPSARPFEVIKRPVENSSWDSEDVIFFMIAVIWDEFIDMR